MSDVMRVHIGKEEWTLGEFVDAFLSYRSRAEKAERERDAYKGDLDAELSGNAALRRDFGARADETMCEFVARLARERDEAKAELSIEAALHDDTRKERDRLMAGACAICATCEGPLTCARCTTTVIASGNPVDLADRVAALERIVAELVK